MKSIEATVSFPGAPSPLSTQISTQISGSPAIVSIHPHVPKLYEQPTDTRALELELEDQDTDILAAARAFIDTREFSRAVHVLKDGRSIKSQFIRVYSKFMVRILTIFPFRPF